VIPEFQGEVGKHLQEVCSVLDVAPALQRTPLHVSRRSEVVLTLSAALSRNPRCCWRFARTLALTTWTSGCGSRSCRRCPRPITATLLHLALDGRLLAEA